MNASSVEPSSAPCSGFSSVTVSVATRGSATSVSSAAASAEAPAGRRRCGPCSATAARRRSRSRRRRSGPRPDRSPAGSAASASAAAWPGLAISAAADVVAISQVGDLPALPRRRLRLLEAEQRDLRRLQRLGGHEGGHRVVEPEQVGDAHPVERAVARALRACSCRCACRGTAARSPASPRSARTAPRPTVQSPPSTSARSPASSAAATASATASMVAATAATFCARGDCAVRGPAPVRRVAAVVTVDAAVGEIAQQPVSRSACGRPLLSRGVRPRARGGAD